MNSDIKAKYELRANILKAMAHPTRLFIMDQLNQKEHCVCELTKMIGADTSTVSKHLSVLKNAGIVNDEKRGNMVYYRIRLSCALDFFGCIDKILEDNASCQLETMK